MSSLTKPSFWKLALELRAGAEWASHFLARYSLPHWPRGKAGTPVLVLPGLATSDLAMAPMRQALQQLGHQPYAWEMGWNTGPNAQQLSALAKRVRRLAKRHRQPVAMVGWSLGGAMARAVAARCPDQVKCVVALGSPLAPTVASHLDGVFSALSGMHSNDPRLGKWMQGPLGQVPLTSIASIDDGLVSSQSSVLPRARRQETILVRGVSHLGIRRILSCCGWSTSD